MYFEQNLIEDTDEIKKKVFMKTIRIIVKDNMGQTVLSFNQKTTLLLCFLAQILLKEKRAESDQIKLALLQKKNLKTFLKGQYQLNHIVPNS